MKTIRVLLLVAMAWLALPASVLAFYNPEGGRWLSRDPIEEKGAKNLYCFVRNTAANAIDLLGLFEPNGPGPNYPAPCCLAHKLPKTCSEICRMATKAAKNGEIWVGGGAVVCYGNKACPCIFSWPKLGYEPGKCPEIDEAFLRHEKQHVPKADCNSCGLYAGGVKGDLTEEECRERTATVAELKALEGTISAECWKVARAVIAFTEKWLNENCEGGHKKPQ